MGKMWGGRFKKSTAQEVEDFTSSIHYDVRFYEEDIQGSIAHVKGLQKVKVISSQEATKIISGLKQILSSFKKGTAKLSPKLEDIHMNIEAVLTSKLGDIGKKVHTGRSRNDQVATDLRLYLKKEIKNIQSSIKLLQKTLLKQAQKNIEVVLPGFTHMQHAQPVLLAHHFLAYVEMLKRDQSRLSDCLKRMDEMPLGSGALAGTAYPINRQTVAADLGFNSATNNSLDAVADRDFVVEFLSAASLIMVHLSRLSEELILWMTHEFNFIQLSDEYTTGSSLMPQKKNPDVAELVRGKTGRVIGSLVSILIVLKGLPLAYNRDLQEDKEGLFDAIDTVSKSLKVMNGMLQGLSANKEVMKRAAVAQYTLATDLADYLVKKGIPFRQAHEITGKIVGYCLKANKQLADLYLHEFKKFSKLIENDVYKAIDLKASLNARNVIGGTAPAKVKAAIKKLKKEIK
ncbi:MAG: argininosuccinate lyase [Candidatus Margulisbacteria bacterium]|nr:argininosuccinate lyase [Candidatus Margulisiibacteriota bacterium]